MTPRRHFIARLGALAVLGLPTVGQAGAAPSMVGTGTLDMAYHDAGPQEGHPVVLVHDLGYDTGSFDAVVPLLVAAGLRVLRPLQRGHGMTRFINPDAPRSAEPAALGKDLIEFIDALHIPEAVFAGVGWGAHAARAAGVIRPTRCVGLVLAGLARIDTADSARFPRAAPSFDNPDFAAILAHAWAYRHTGAAGDPAYAALASRLTPIPAPATAAVVLPDVSPATLHDAPRPFADAAIALCRAGKWRT